VRRPHARTLVRWARSKPDVVVLSADLTASCEADDFREACADRFFSLGMAEQNMVGFAAGLAREGFIPYIHTFAVFITRRAFDQVAMSVAYPNLPVRLLGFLPGITTPGGVTHQATDDVALMRAIPNMTVLECGDATEVESVLPVAHAIDGPVYVRMLRGEMPRLFSEPMKLGRARVLGRGDDVALITSGVCTEEAMRAATALGARGVAVSHVHLSTLKPFPTEAVLEAIGTVKGVVAVENHSIVGGLGSAVAEAMAEHGAGKRLVRLGLRDCYAHGASRRYLMAEYGLDAGAIVAAVGDLLDTRFEVEESELAAVDPAPGVATAENL
jgi:transketolase